MASYPRCPECGNYINRYSAYLTEARKAINRESITDDKFKDYNAEKMVFNPNTTVELGKLLDALDIKNVCCRSHLFTKVNFKEGK